MINLFEIATNDKSMDYLYRLFGYMGGVISPTFSTSLLGTMFKTFNSAILAVAALLLLYVTVVGVMQTAHEGEFMGTKWNKIWVPIRTVLGIASLIPTASGYSAIQLVMMWIVVQGIGAADSLWSTAIQFIQDNGGISSKSIIPDAGTASTLQQLYQGLVCDATAKQTGADPSDIDGAKSYCNISDNPKGDSKYCASVITFPSANCKKDKCAIVMGPSGACGTFYYCNEAKACSGNDLVGCKVCQGQQQILSQIIPQMVQLASQFATTDFTYRQFYYKPAITPTPDFVTKYCDEKGITSVSCSASTNIGAFPTPNDKDKYPNNASNEALEEVYWPYSLQATHTLSDDSNATFIDVWSQAYTNAVNEAALAAMGEGEELSDKLEAARAYGWIYAGAFYYTLAGVNNKNLKSSLPEFSVATKNPSESSSMKRNFRNNYNAAAELMDSISNTNVFSSSSPDLKGVGGIMGMLVGSVFGVFQQMFITDTNSDPLAKLQSLGAAILLVVGAIFVILISFVIRVALVGYLSGFALGFGFVNPAGPSFSLMFFTLMPLIFGLFGALFLVGISLSVYVPLIPFLVFTFGAIGWLIAVIETMVAGPLVALGIISPAGQHELLGRAEAALMHMFGVFLRPSLMIFGFMAGMLLARVIVMFINGAFQLAIATMAASAGGAAAVANPVSFVLFYIFYAFTIVTALNKCFSTIYIIPSRVMTWIGGHEAHYGEAESLSEVKGGGMGAAGGMKGTISHADSTAKSGVKEAKDAKANKEAEQKGKKPEIKGTNT